MSAAPELPREPQRFIEFSGTNKLRCVLAEDYDSLREHAIALRRRVLELEADAARLDWYERQHTLHYSLEFIYVVDGYELSKTRDGNVQWTIHEENLRATIDAAMSGGHDG